MADLARQMQLARFKHSQLFTKQMRVRHLQSISLRNYESALELPIASASSELLYFTLHVTRDERAVQIYESERIKCSSNLNWQPFKLAANEVITDTCLAAKAVLVRFWSKHGENLRLFLEYDVSLNGLVCLSQKATLSSADIFPPIENSVVFGLFDGLYIAASVGTTVEGRFNATVAVTDMEADYGLVKSTYKLQTLSRLQTLLRALKQTEVKATVVRRAIDEQLAKLSHIQRKREERQLCAVRVNVLQRELQSAIQQLQTLKEQKETAGLVNHQRKMQLEDKNDILNGDYSRLGERRKVYLNAREELLKTNAQLWMRRKQLVNDFATVYPIVETQVESRKEHTIAGVRLAVSENFDGYDEMTVSVALGYVCHLLSMVSMTVDIPLRYPVSYCGSRSLIYDYVNSQINEKERGFGLYGKNRDKFIFTYAVYLLNKNIAQLRYCFGIMTSDLRPTLYNIKSLLESRLGVIKSQPARLSFLKSTAEHHSQASSGRQQQTLNGQQQSQRQHRHASGAGSPKLPHQHYRSSASGDRLSSSGRNSPHAGRKKLAEAGTNNNNRDGQSTGVTDVTDGGHDGQVSEASVTLSTLSPESLSHEHLLAMMGSHDLHDIDASSSEGSGSRAYSSQFAKLWSSSLDTPSLLNAQDNCSSDSSPATAKTLEQAEPTFLIQQHKRDDKGGLVVSGDDVVPSSARNDASFSAANDGRLSKTPSSHSLLDDGQQTATFDAFNNAAVFQDDCDSSLIAADDFLARTHALSPAATFQFVPSHADADSGGNVGDDDLPKGLLDASIP